MQLNHRYVESWKTEAYREGWYAAEAGTERDANPHSGGKFADWYDWNAAWLERNRIGDARD